MLYKLDDTIQKIWPFHYYNQYFSIMFFIWTLLVFGLSHYRYLLWELLLNFYHAYTYIYITGTCKKMNLTVCKSTWWTTSVSTGIEFPFSLSMMGTVEPGLLGLHPDICINFSWISSQRVMYPTHPFHHILNKNQFSSFKQLKAISFVLMLNFTNILYKV